MTDNYLKRQLPKWLRAVELEPAGAPPSSDRKLSHLSRGHAAWSRCSRYDLARAWSVVWKRFRPPQQCSSNKRPYLWAPGRRLGIHRRCRRSRFRLAGTGIEVCVRRCAGILSANWLGLSPSVTELPERALATSRRRSEALRSRRALPRQKKKAFFDKEPQFDGTENPLTQREGQLLQAAY